ncbi:surfeit locus protein 6 isoform X1 [Camelus ferus]|uniref:Surfeit locus protein 6 isoform X1 n=2 Tax=Camelus TaxID=9836 RepID=A0A8B8SXS9_CAMFR|nr:surfeit locus protein 6 isoform X1 [Camelus ferus]
MASLLAKDAYLQSLARKICSQPSPDSQKRKSGKAQPGAGTWRASEGGAPPPPAAGVGVYPTPHPSSLQLAKLESQKLVGPQRRRGRKPRRNPGSGMRRLQSPRFTPLQRSLRPESLRQPWRKKRPPAPPGPLPGGAEELSPAALEKRRRRKQERDRKKRKRKELRAKEKAATAPAAAAAAAAEAAEAPREEAAAQAPPGLLFSKVEVCGAEPAGQAGRRKEKRRKLKGNLTPLTGRNYRQLLERLRARRARLEELREQDAGRARELEARMRWTNLLYKAEGVRIRDDEQRLQDALRRKERRRARRRRTWEKRTAHVVEQMQQRQDRRRQNLRRKKAAKAERRLEKARKKGRILPQDLERAGLA